MKNDNNVHTMTVCELCNDEHYMIPIYQRNYAWGTTEVDALIDDIWDSCVKDKGKSYYIGSLVVSKRKNGKYEVVDGQQRLTTLKILLAAQGIGKNINLEFESREVSTETLKDFEKENGSVAIQSVYKHCKKLKDNHKKIAWDLFKSYLLDQVKIIRTVLPDHTDLNHYFEIMNNRGEQLEKHDILKARFMKTLSDHQEKASFAKIWDACSQMDGYVVKHFSVDERKQLFGDKLNQLPENFDGVNNTLIELEEKKDGNESKQADANSDEVSIESLLTGALAPAAKESRDIEEPYSSIIQFSNFLLHVLRVFLKTKNEMEGKEVALDDKQLLNVFDKDTSTSVIKVENAKGFAYTLLKCRFLFDQYVIKSHAKDRWTLRSVTYNSKEKSMYESMYEMNTYDEKSLSDANMMIQSMFHVSYPTQNYKYWLDALLTYLCEQNMMDKKDGELLKFMEKLSDRFFFGRFGKGGVKDYDEILKCENVFASDIDVEKYLHVGTAVHNFIFNRLDYLLWKKSHGSSSINTKDFHFTFRSSVEHFYPQNPKSVKKLDSCILDYFGNLCLISASKNSELSNYSPIAKKEHYDKISTDSLKQQLMMCKADSWGAGAIKAHGEEMLKVLRIACQAFIS